MTALMALSVKRSKTAEMRGEDFRNVKEWEVVWDIGIPKLEQLEEEKEKLGSLRVP